MRNTYTPRSENRIYNSAKALALTGLVTLGTYSLHGCDTGTNNEGVDQRTENTEEAIRSIEKLGYRVEKDKSDN